MDIYPYRNIFPSNINNTNIIKNFNIINKSNIEIIIHKIDVINMLNNILTELQLNTYSKNDIINYITNFINTLKDSNDF
jgi:hypothetical protein